MNKLANIFLVLSILLLVVSAILLLGSQKHAPSLPTITSTEISSGTVFLNSLLENENIRHYQKSKIDSTRQPILIIHTLRALSCSNCVFDTKLLVERLDYEFDNISQIIWYIDKINPYSISVGKKHSLDKSYLIGNTPSFDRLFESNSERNDRTLLVFKGERLTRRILLPYRIEFYEVNDRETILKSIINEVNHEITNQADL